MKLPGRIRVPVPLRKKNYNEKMKENSVKNNKKTDKKRLRSRNDADAPDTVKDTQVPTAAAAACQ